MATADGVVSDKEWLRIIVESIREIVTGTPWKLAFRSNGLVPQQVGVSMRILSKLGWHQVPAAADAAPTLSQLRVVFPKRMKLKSARIVEYDAVVPKAAVPKPPKPSVFHVGAPISSRTRLRGKTPPCID